MPQTSALSQTLSAAALALSLTACAQGGHYFEEAGAVSGSGGTAGAGGSSVTGTGGAGAGGWGGEPWDGSVSCAEPTQFVYVVTTTSDIYRFWPPTLSFEHVGHLDCPTEGWTPLSMAIDKHARAWVLYWDQVVYRVDLGTGECVESGYNAEHALPSPFGYFGMAFTADAASPEGESLMVRQAAFYDLGADPGVRPLARLDTLTTKLSTIGEGLGGNADLAGTGDGKVFGFEKVPGSSGEAVGQLAEYDPSTGERIAVTPLDGITIGDAWAVAVWGGDVWLFTSPLGAATNVVRYQPTTGDVDVVVANTGFEVIGAGVSACAPLTPPK